MNEEELINLIKEIFEDIDEVSAVYKIEFMKYGKIKIQYKHKYHNFLCETIFRKEFLGE